jgi:hypothetical protein
MLPDPRAPIAQMLSPITAGDPTAPIAEDILVLAEAFSLLIAMDRQLHPLLYKPQAVPPLGTKSDD